MTQDTYERNQGKHEKKETFEWITSWCDYANKEDLPRVLLIGDSIVRSYQGLVREDLRGICYVDYVSTSYALDNPIYKRVIVDMAKNSAYDLILFNFGLHGGHIGARSYAARYAKIVDELAKCAPVMPITTTTVYKKDSSKLDTVWKKKCAARNAAVWTIAREKGLSVCDLFSLCAEIPYEMRTTDGYHFKEDGCRILGDKVTGVIRAFLSK